MTRDVIGIKKESNTNSIIRRDEEIFRELFQAYAKLLWAVAGGILSEKGGAEQDIEECVSDAFIELWNRPEKYDPTRGSVKSYLCRITKNKAIDIYRRKSRENVIAIEEYMEAPGADRFDVPDYSRLYEAVEGLQEPTREILVRRYFHDEKPARIAKRLGLPIKEVENRLYRGKKALMESLSGYREEN